jgi:hypothetical protein
MKFVLAFICGAFAIHFAGATGSRLDLHGRYQKYIKQHSEEIGAEIVTEQTPSLRTEAAAPCPSAQFKFLKVMFFDNAQCGGNVIGESQLALNRCVPWTSDRDEQQFPETKWALMTAEMTAKGKIAVRTRYFKDPQCKIQAEKALMSFMPGAQQCAPDDNDQAMRFTLAPDATTYDGLHTTGIAWTFYTSKAQTIANDIQEASRIVYFPNYSNYYSWFFDCNEDNDFLPGGMGHFSQISGCSADAINYSTYSSTDQSCQGTQTSMTLDHSPELFTAGGAWPNHVWKNFVCVTPN